MSQGTDLPSKEHGGSSREPAPHPQGTPDLHPVVVGQVLVVVDEEDVFLQPNQQVSPVVGKGQALWDAVHLQVPAGQKWGGG